MTAVEGGGLVGEWPRCLLWAFFTFPGWNGGSRLWLGSLSEGPLSHTRQRAAGSLSHLGNCSRSKAHTRSRRKRNGTFQWQVCKAFAVVRAHKDNKYTIPPPVAVKVSGRQMVWPDTARPGGWDWTAGRHDGCEKNLVPEGPGDAKCSPNAFMGRQDSPCQRTLCMARPLTRAAGCSEE